MNTLSLAMAHLSNLVMWVICWYLMKISATWFTLIDFGPHRPGLLRSMMRVHYALQFLLFVVVANLVLDVGRIAIQLYFNGRLT